MIITCITVCYAWWTVHYVLHVSAQHVVCQLFPRHTSWGPFALCRHWYGLHSVLKETRIITFGKKLCIGEFGSVKFKAFRLKFFSTNNYLAIFCKKGDIHLMNSDTIQSYAIYILLFIYFYNSISHIIKFFTFVYHFSLFK